MVLGDGSAGAGPTPSTDVVAQPLLNDAAAALDPCGVGVPGEEPQGGSVAERQASGAVLMSRNAWEVTEHLLGAAMDALPVGEPLDEEDEEDVKDDEEVDSGDVDDEEVGEVDEEGVEDTDEEVEADGADAPPGYSEYLAQFSGLAAAFDLDAEPASSDQWACMCSAGGDAGCGADPDHESDSSDEEDDPSGTRVLAYHAYVADRLASSAVPMSRRRWKVMEYLLADLRPATPATADLLPLLDDHHAGKPGAVVASLSAETNC